jgi:hypothetical protein
MHRGVRLFCIIMALSPIFVACTKAKLVNRGTAALDEAKLSPPTLVSVVPPEGPFSGGTAITITGTGFQAGATVTIGNILCSLITIVSDTTITCVTPPHAIGAVTVTINNPDGQQVTLTNAYAFRDTVYPVAGYAVVVGGGISTGPGVQARVSIGEPYVGNRQAVGGIQVFPGVQGVLFDP